MNLATRLRLLFTLWHQSQTLSLAFCIYPLCWRYTSIFIRKMQPASCLILCPWVCEEINVRHSVSRRRGRPGSLKRYRPWGTAQAAVSVWQLWWPALLRPALCGCSQAISTDPLPLATTTERMGYSHLTQPAKTRHCLWECSWVCSSFSLPVMDHDIYCNFISTSGTEYDFIWILDIILCDCKNISNSLWQWQIIS